jgi:replication factor C subunit 2/4
MSLPWVEKYRPQVISDISYHTDIMNMLHNCVETNNMPHLLFYGPPGTGKTSSILAICRELYGDHFSARVVEMNASDERGINVVRQKIKHFAKLSVGTGNNKLGKPIPAYKMIILDEADCMTREAQDALRVIIEKHCAVTRFCFICNYISQMIEPIKSRCAIFNFKPLDSKSMRARLTHIATEENMKCKDSVFDVLIDLSNGDMRKAIMNLQNIKYVYEARLKAKGVTLDRASIEDVKLFSELEEIRHIDDIEINESDILELTGNLHQSVATNILFRCIQAQTVNVVVDLVRKIIAQGYPVDNCINQINKICVNSDKLKDIHKARIISVAAKIQKRVKECGNEYLQLLDYLSSIYQISHDEMSPMIR